MQIENIELSRKLDNKAFVLFVLYFLTSSISQLVALLSSKKQFSLTREVNLKIKEYNCEKAGFRAINTENNADRFISWRRIINDATEYSTH